MARTARRGTALGRAGTHGAPRSRATLLSAAAKAPLQAPACDAWARASAR
jgi:hypothetical protein